MRRGILFLAVVVFGWGAVWAGEAEEEWTRLDADSLPAEWVEFEERLAARPWVVADFSERRYFSFRSRPVELSGTVWFGRKEGLTLAYKEPRREIVRIDENGMRIISDDGRGRGRGAGERGGEIPAALLALFRFDLSELAAIFSMEGWRKSGDWGLRLTPIDREKTPLEEVVLRGSGDEMRRVAVLQEGSRRIELGFSGTVYPEKLDAAERAKIFP